MKRSVRQMMNLTVLLITGLLFVQAAVAQIDQSFGMNGSVTTDVFNDDRVLNSFVLPGDKILIVASGTLGTQNKFYLIRYNSDGTFDSTYGTNGIINLTFPAITNATFTNAARQSDGKIILTGSFGSNSLIVRVNEDGTLDSGFAGSGYQIPNFNPNGNDKIDSIGIQSDGKIIIASAFNLNFGGSHFYLTRYMPDGGLDSSFGNGGVINYINFIIYGNYSTDILFQSNGKIIVNFAQLISNSSGNFGEILRFNSDGSRDQSFLHDYPSGFNLSQSPIVIQSDDKILAVGSISKTETLERSHYDIAVLRYNSDGTLDSSFGSGGKTDVDLTTYFDDSPRALTIDASGKIIVSGRTYIQPNKSQVRDYQTSLISLNAAGQITGKFLFTDKGNASRINVLSNGKILLTGIASAANNQYDVFLLRAVGVPLRTYYFRGTPFDFNYISYIAQPAAADIAVFRSSNLNWYYDPSVGEGTYFGDVNDIRVPADYISDFRTELAVFRPNNGTWYIGRYSLNPAQNFVAVQWGQSGDIPVPADYDGDSKADIAVYRPSNGYWYIRNSANNLLTAYQFGAAEDKPVPGDYDGDGKSDIAVFRPSNGYWYQLKSSQGFAAVQFGASEDLPVQEDYDGDGKTDIAVRRLSNGYWYRINSVDNSFTAVSWGFSTDKTVPADYDGDSKTDIAVWRLSTAQWYVLKSSTNLSVTYNWGITSDLPIQERK